MNNQLIVNFTDSVKAITASFYARHPLQNKFLTPNDSIIQERIMRLGIEAKALQATTPDELYAVALSTLHLDYIKHV